MTDEELEASARAMLDDERDKALVPAYMPEAKSRVAKRLWPFDPSKTWDDVPERDQLAAASVCAFLVGKRGVEGETRHVENGTTHEWGSGDVPAEMFGGIVPHAGVPL